MKCKYTNKSCNDRYYSGTRAGYFCRVVEWKKKKGVCPYDKDIKSKVRIKNKIDKNQTRLI